MSDTREVIVLQDGVCVDEVLAIAAEQGWELREQTTRAHLVLASRRWITRDGLDVTHVADHPGGAQSLRIEGKRAGSLARRLRERLATHSESELLAAVLAAPSPDPVVCIRVASKLAACRPRQMAPRHLQALERLLSHPVVAVRRAGIRSAYTCRWPQLREIVGRRLVVEDRLSAQLRHLQQYLVDAYPG